MNRGKKAKKGKDSDEEEEIELTEEKQVAVPTKAELQAQELANVPAIPDSEVSPAAYIFQQIDDKDDLGLYEEKSTKIKCPYCDAVSNSIVEYQPSLLGYLLTMIAMLIFGFLSLILMPFLVSLTKTAIHRCAKCLNQVQDNSYFGFSSLEDKLFMYEIGSFGIILTRRTMLYAVMTLTGCLAIYVFILVEDAHLHSHFNISGVTWPKYLTVCGYEAFHSDPRGAKRSFNQQFFRRGVAWDGYVTRVNFNEDNPLSMSYHSANILVKMDQDDREGVHGPDLGLSISEMMLGEYSEIVGSLHRGDHIRFNATMQSMGDSSHLHHLQVHGLEKIEGHRDVEAHAYSNGRYKVRIEPHDGKDHSHDEPTAHSIVLSADKKTETAKTVTDEEPEPYYEEEEEPYENEDSDTSASTAT